MTILLGTSGWTYSSWDGTFYPASLDRRKKLEYYATRYPTVELNASFYRWPPDTSFDSWHRRLPEGFEMTVKAPKALTHTARLRDPDGEWARRIRASYARLGSRGGPLLLQMPATLPRDDAALSALLGSLAPLRVAVEMRHPSWYDEDVFALLERHGAAYVVMSGPRLPEVVRATSDIAYVRWHGSDPKRMFYGSYDDDALARWADVLRGFEADGRRVYGYFNNDMSGRAIANLDTLRGLVG